MRVQSSGDGWKKVDVNRCSRYATNAAIQDLFRSVLTVKLEHKFLKKDLGNRAI